MSRLLSEKAALKKLSADSFENLSDSQLQTFAQILHRIDPVVSKAAMDSFIGFRYDAVVIAKALTELLSKLSESDQEDDKTIFKSLSELLSKIDDRLHMKEFSQDDREFVEDNLIFVAQSIALSKTTLKKIVLRELKYIGVGFLIVLPFILAFAKGFSGNSSASDIDDEDIDYDLDDLEDYRDFVLSQLPDDEYIEFAQKLDDPLYDEYLDPDSPFYEPGPPIIVEDDW